MTEYTEPKFYRDEHGNQLVKRLPRANEYAVSNPNNDWEKSVAMKAGFQIVELDADGLVTEPMRTYLFEDTPADAFDSAKWSALREQIKGAFIGAATPEESTSAPADTPESTAPKPGSSEYAEVMFHRGEAPRLTTTTLADGSTVTELVRTAPRFGAPTEAPRAPGFNPNVPMDSYVAARQRGLVPDVRVKVEGEAPRTPTMEEWVEERRQYFQPSEMDLYVAARQRGEVPQ